MNTYILLYNRFMALWILSGTTRVNRYQKGKNKTNMDFLEQETVSSSGISCAILSAHRLTQITTPAPHHSLFSQAGCTSCHPTNSIKALKARMSTYILCTKRLKGLTLNFQLHVPRVKNDAKFYSHILWNQGQLPCDHVISHVPSRKVIAIWT